MADIELVVKIPEELYIAYKDRPSMLGDAGMDVIAQSIANGTPLPKGHGRLIDADKAIDSINKEIAKHDEMMAKYETYRNTQIPGWMWKGVCEESTIIEADKEQG